EVDGGKVREGSAVFGHEPLQNRFETRAKLTPKGTGKLPTTDAWYSQKGESRLGCVVVYVLEDREQSAPVEAVVPLCGQLTIGRSRLVPVSRRISLFIAQESTGSEYQHPRKRRHMR